MSILLTKGNVEDVFKVLDNHNINSSLMLDNKLKALEVIKKKCLHNDNLNYVAVCINYDMYKEKMSEKHDTVVVKTNWNDKVLLDCLNLLNQEEFELLKRWSDNENNK